MKKLFKTLLAFSMAFALCACGGPKGSDTITGTYSMHVGGYDWGCGTDKVIISLDYVVDAVAAEDFVVTETKNMTNWGQNPNVDFGAAYEGTVDRTVTKAYLCDETGAEVTEASQYVALELFVDPNTGSPFIYSLASGLNAWCDPYYLTITLAEGAAITSAGTEVASFTVDTTPAATTTAADMFEEKDWTATDGTKYSYATYTKEGAKTLFVWLHGMGEGGTDTSITLLANKVTALAGEEFQNTVGGAHILVPQCETFWMNEGTDSPAMTGASIYTASLTELIDTYKTECGAEKVVISGCSNGGYMTMVMAMVNGNKYDAYVPICEAVLDAEIDETELATLKELPIYFIHAENDTTVDPLTTSVPTYNRLKEAGAGNVHTFTPANVEDTSGQYKDADGSPYDYAGHWSWVYFDNNDTTCDECGETAWDWIASVVNPQ